MINAVIDNEIEGRRWFSWGMRNFDAAVYAFGEHDVERALVYSKLAIEDLTVFRLYQNGRGHATPFVELYISKARELAQKSDTALVVARLVERLVT